MNTHRRTIVKHARTSYLASYGRLPDLWFSKRDILHYCIQIFHSEILFVRFFFHTFSLHLFGFISILFFVDVEVVVVVDVVSSICCLFFLILLFFVYRFAFCHALQFSCFLFLFFAALFLIKCSAFCVYILPKQITI